MAKVNPNKLDSRELEFRRLQDISKKELDREIKEDDRERNKIMIREKNGKRMFVQHSTHHPSDLKFWANKKGALNEDGTLNVEAAKSHARQIGDRDEREHRLRQIRFVETMKKIRRNKVHKR